MLAAYNRVRVEKSSFDRFLGRVAFHTAGAGTFTAPHPGGGGVINFNLYQQGHLIVLEALRALMNGLTYTTWAATAGGGVETVREQLPPLAQADKVLFVGHSGGAHGLYHNIDHFARLLPGVDTRALFDANFLPSIENEAAFANQPGGGAPLGGDAYTSQWAGRTVETSGSSFDYDGEDFLKTGIHADQMRSWKTRFDTSCIAAHPAATEWQCRDRMHLLFNHIATPFAFREDFSDPNQEHTNGGLGHTVLWGDEAAFPYCPAGMSCPPRFSLAQHRDRLMEQAGTLMSDSDTRSALALGTDPSGGGNFPSAWAWMPMCRSHNGAYDDKPFFATGITYLGTTVSMRQWIEQFMVAPRFGPTQWRIHGYQDPGGNIMATAPCP